jgi:RNA polymerase sigma factor (sigma-70 family)
MGDTVRERALWVARNILPHEPVIRAWLKRGHLYGLDIDDVIQEMYARIVSLDQLEAIRHPKRYAFQTANSIIVDHVRRARVVSINSVGDLDDLGLAAPDASPEEQVTFRDEIREVAEALATLPERCRETLILRRVEGLSQRATAERLGVSEKAIEKYMARGVLMLMSRFGRGGKSLAGPSNSATLASKHNENETDVATKSGD